MFDPGAALLQEYLTADSETAAEALLGRLLEDVATPIVRRVVQSVRRDSGGVSDAEDVVANTLMDLLRRLREARADASDPIRDFRGYIATCAYNRCHEWLRERYPARTRLRNQLQYLFGHDPRLTLWRAADGVLMCGFRDHSVAPVSGRRLETLAISVLRDLGAPLELDALVAAVARINGVADHRGVPLDAVELIAPSSPETELVTRMSLAQLWADVGRLSSRQRMALLLNLRDVHGRECLSLLPLTRTATIAEIAAVLEIPLRRFAVLWNELPLSDAIIAEMIEATPRQVIKLRRLARERLRRMSNRQNEPLRGRGRNLQRELHSSTTETLHTR